MKVVKHFVIFLLCFALLYGCGANITANNLTSTSEASIEATEDSTELPANNADVETTHETYSEEQLDAFMNPDETSISEPVTIELNGDFSGTMEYTITAARIIAPGDDAKLEIEDFKEYTCVETDPEIQYPDYLTDNGQLVDGCYLVQLDVHVENIDAVGSENYGDATLFRADCIHLDNSEYGFDETVDSYYVVTAKSPDYFSGLNEFEQHPMLFRLEQGQSTDYTIGYLVNEQWAVQDAASLIATISGNNGSFQIPLKLGESA